MLDNESKWFYSPKKGAVTDEWGFMVADVFGYNIADRDFHGRMIEAAPKMLRMLEHIEDVMDDSSGCGEISIEKIRKILKEVKGEQ